LRGTAIDPQVTFYRDPSPESAEWIGEVSDGTKTYRIAVEDHHVFLARQTKSGKWVTMSSRHARPFREAVERCLGY
jgi:hypothetical protein